MEKDIKLEYLIQLKNIFKNTHTHTIQLYFGELYNNYYIIRKLFIYYLLTIFLIYIIALSSGFPMPLTFSGLYGGLIIT